MKNLTATEARDMSMKTPRYARNKIDIAIRREAKKGNFVVTIYDMDFTDEVIDGLAKDGFSLTNVGGGVKISWVHKSDVKQ